MLQPLGISAEAEAVYVALGPLRSASVAELARLTSSTSERVAETLGVTRWTVYARSDRAIKAMRAVLEADARSVAMPAPVRRESVR